METDIYFLMGEPDCSTVIEQAIQMSEALVGRFDSWTLESEARGAGLCIGR